MTSCGQVTTHPAQPVHRPVVMTSAYSSFHWAVHRPAMAGGVAPGDAGADSTEVMGVIVGESDWSFVGRVAAGTRRSPSHPSEDAKGGPGIDPQDAAMRPE